MLITCICIYNLKVSFISFTGRVLQMYLEMDQAPLALSYTPSHCRSSGEGGQEGVAGLR